MWNASAPDARGGRPSRIAAIMSASPIPRPTSPSNWSGTSVQSRSPKRRSRTAPSKWFGSPRLSEPAVPWISMCGEAVAATSNEAVKPPIAPDANRYTATACVWTWAANVVPARGPELITRSAPRPRPAAATAATGPSRLTSPAT